MITARPLLRRALPALALGSSIGHRAHASMPKRGVKVDNNIHTLMRKMRSTLPAALARIALARHHSSPGFDGPAILKHNPKDESAAEKLIKLYQLENNVFYEAKAFYDKTYGSDSLEPRFGERCVSTVGIPRPVHARDLFNSNEDVIVARTERLKTLQNKMLQATVKSTKLKELTAPMSPYVLSVGRLLSLLGELDARCDDGAKDDYADLLQLQTLVFEVCAELENALYSSVDRG